ncbi:MAG: hypothetical protein V8T45_12905 [Oscillospiraceae bacterium]
MYKNILFEFDGTVFDTVEGITRSAQYALKKTGDRGKSGGAEVLCRAAPCG